jgi:hypothetical protein
MQPHAPFMAASYKRSSAQPSEMSTDTFVTQTHPDNQQHVEYGQEHYGYAPQQGEYGQPYVGGLHSDQYGHTQSQYGALHSNLSAADVAALQPGYPPRSPGGSPGGSPAQYTDLPPHSDTYGHSSRH